MEIAKKCVYCGKKFMAKTLKTKYCSLPCNQKHWKLRKKRENLNQSNLSPIQDPSIIPYDTQLSSIKEKEYLTNKEVMILLSISRTSLYRMIKKNYLSSVKVGSKVMIRRKDIDTLFNDQISNNKNEPISLNSDDKSYENGYFCIGEISNFYDISQSSIDRLLISKKVEKIKEGRYTYVSRKDVIKIFGKPRKTPKVNG